jgi:hypothetical protein
MRFEVATADLRPAMVFDRVQDATAMVSGAGNAQRVVVETSIARCIL